MSKFTVPKKNPYASGDTYLSFFIWRDKIYPIGIPIISSKNFNPKYKINTVILEEHYFDGITERWGYRLIGTDGKITPTKINYVYDTHRDLPDEVIEYVEAEPINADLQEYVDFIENYKTTHMTANEKREFRESIKNGQSIQSAMPERFKDDPEAIPKPSFNDFNCPGVISGWIVFAMCIILAGVFKDWYIQWIIRIYAIWKFTTWRRNKLYGIN